MPSPDDRSTIAILGGCGHVGLPLGVAFASAGHRVALVDHSESRSRTVEEGRSPFLERGVDERLSSLLANGSLRVSPAAEALASAEVVILTIGTPVDEYLNPSTAELDDSLEAARAHLLDGQLLIVRSTVFPGLVERIARQLEDLHVDVAYCPERIAQGYALDELPKFPQIVAGATPRATERAKRLFGTIVTRVIELDPLEAELAKLFSNAYRYINFAIANQFYMLSKKFGVDYGRVYRAATADYPRLSGLAMSGFAGGPCLFKDTMQLASFNHHSFPLGQAAMIVNEGLPAFLVDDLKKTYPMATLTVGILGMAFKGNSDDHRGSLSYKLRKILELEAASVLCTDPFIDDPSFVPLEECVARADLLILGACHDAYRDLVTEKPIVDVFGFIDAPGATS